MKRKTIATAALAAALVAGIAGLSGCRRGATAYTIEIGGSTAVVPVIEVLAAGFRLENPRVRININGTGSSDGIRNAGSLYQLGMTSRYLTSGELMLGLSERLVAIDGIAVILHHSSPVENLSLDQIRGIYSGEISDWSEVHEGKSGTIAVFTREEGSGTRGAFEEMVGFSGFLRAGAIEGPSTGAVRSGVGSNPAAIGYISVGSVDGTVRAVSVDSHEPTAANMTAGLYRIARPFTLLHRDLHPATREFLNWATGPEGQALVAASWVPIN